MKYYLLLTPDEDGNPLTFLDEEELREFLADPLEYAGVEKFLTRLDENGTDPNYWNDGEGMLLEVKILKPVAGGFKLEE